MLHERGAFLVIEQQVVPVFALGRTRYLHRQAHVGKEIAGGLDDCLAGLVIVRGQDDAPDPLGQIDAEELGRAETCSTRRTYRKSKRLKSSHICAYRMRSH